MSILTDKSLSIALEAAYQAGRVLTFRDGADHMLTNLRQKASTDPAAEAAVRFLDGIARDLGRPISALSEDQAAARVHELEVEMQARTSAEWGHDPARGQEALAAMRATSDF